MTDTPAEAEADHRRAILVMCAGAFSLTVGDVISKDLLERYSALHVVFIRSLLATPLAVIVVLLMDGAKGLRSKTPGVHLLRGAVGFVASMAFISALALMPLADAVALVFTAPLFITVISVAILRERVGPRRVAALLTGFLGVLIILRPGMGVMQAAALLPLCAAAFYGTMMISARWIDKGDSVWTLMLYMTVLATVFSSVSVFTSWPTPIPRDYLSFLGLAVFSTLGLALLSQAFRMAPASVVAPFDYSALLWAVFFGWLIFGDIPDLPTMLGGLIIAASGLFLIQRAEVKVRQN